MAFIKQIESSLHSRMSQRQREYIDIHFLTENSFSESQTSGGFADLSYSRLLFVLDATIDLFRGLGEVESDVIEWISQKAIQPVLIIFPHIVIQSRYPRTKNVIGDG